jgi:hypothetical protein
MKRLLFKQRQDILRISAGYDISLIFEGPLRIKEYKGVGMRRSPQILALILLQFICAPLVISEPELKMDVVIVFDTTGSMGGKIDEMKEYARSFADYLASSGIDYRLGLTEFKDYDYRCNDNDCGASGDFPYRIYNDGVLTSSPTAFESWIGMLSASGGGDSPESIYSALKHTATDQRWRGDTDKMAILITDGEPHPDGDCCNRGETQESVISALRDRGITAYVIGPDDESLEVFAARTGGELYANGGSALQPMLERVISAAKIQAEGHYTQSDEVSHFPYGEVLGGLAVVGAILLLKAKGKMPKVKGKKDSEERYRTSYPRFLPKKDPGSQVIESNTQELAGFDVRIIPVLDQGHAEVEVGGSLIIDERREP